jgi:hypothetical protein
MADTSSQPYIARAWFGDNDVAIAIHPTRDGAIGIIKAAHPTIREIDCQQMEREPNGGSYIYVTD